MNEAYLEPFLRQQRLRRVMPYLMRYEGCRMLDIGCGWDARLLKAAVPHIGTGVGIDFKAPRINSEKITTISLTLNDNLPFEDNSFDFITMLAVLEHLDNPIQILSESARLLRPGGGILLTVPSWQAKPVLEFLAYQLGVVNADEIRDHKRYFNFDDLKKLFSHVPSLKIESHRYFQFGFNNQIFAIKYLGNN